MNKIVSALAVGTLLSFANAEEGGKNRGWSISVGPVFRQSMEISISGRSHVQNGGYHAATPFFHGVPASSLGNRGTMPPAPTSGVLPLTGFADRTYDDGFVNIGSTTGIGGSLAPNHTWFWGYDHSSQVDSSANTLTFNREVETGNYTGQIVDTGVQTRRTMETIHSHDLTESRDINGTGVEASAGKPWDVSSTTSLYFRVGISLIQGEDVNISSSPFREQVSTRDDRVTTTHNFEDTYTARDQYVYSLLDPANNPITPRAPGDPGTFNGLPLPSPLIPNEPASFNRTSEILNRDVNTSVQREYLGTSRFEAWNVVDLDVETSALQVYAGPEVVKKTGSVQLFGAVRVSLNYLEIDVSRTERFISNRGGSTTELMRWNDKGDDGTFSLGAAVSGGAQIDLTDLWFLRGEYGRDWVFEEAEATVGPNEVSFDASGSTGKVLIGRRL